MHGDYILRDDNTTVEKLRITKFFGVQITEEDPSDFECLLFQSITEDKETIGIVWRPSKKNLPSIFRRLIHKLLLGNILQWRRCT